jgi:hypothetical protein
VPALADHQVMKPQLQDFRTILQCFGMALSSAMDSRSIRVRRNRRRCVTAIRASFAPGKCAGPRAGNPARFCRRFALRNAMTSEPRQVPARPEGDVYREALRVRSVDDRRVVVLSTGAGDACRLLLFVRSRAETSNRRISGNEISLDRSGMFRQDPFHERSRRDAGGICKRKMRCRNAGCAGIPDRVRNRARRPDRK